MWLYFSFDVNNLSEYTLKIARCFPPSFDPFLRESPEFVFCTFGGESLAGMLPSCCGDEYITSAFIVESGDDRAGVDSVKTVSTSYAVNRSLCTLHHHEHD